MNVDEVRNNLSNMQANVQPQLQPRTEPEEKGILDSMIDGVSEAVQWVEDTPVGQFVTNAAREVYEDTRDVLTAKNWNDMHEAYNRHDLTNTVFNVANDNNSIFQPVAQAVQQSAVGYDYLFSDTGKLTQARRISQELGIPVEVTMTDSDTWKKANQVYQEDLEIQKLASDSGRQYSIEDIYKVHPDIRKIAEQDPAAGALILKDMPQVRRQLDIIDGFSQYLEMGNKQLELNNLRYKSMTGEITDNDKQRMQDLEKQLDIEQQLYEVKFRDNPLLFALSGVGQSLPEMGQSVYAGLEDAAAWSAAGTWAGAAAGSVVPGAGTAAGAAVGGTAGGALGFIKGTAKAMLTSEARKEMVKQAARQAAWQLTKNGTTPQLMRRGMEFGTFGGMFAPETGDRYAEFKNLRDAQGNPLMSDDEARRYAILGGAANAGLEVFPTFGILGKIASPGTQAGKVIGDIIASNTAKTKLASDMKSGAFNLLKNTMKVGFTESFEEGTQQAADDIIKNSIKENHGRAYSEKYGVLYDEGKVLTASEILGNAVEAAVEAVPSSIIFGLGGGIGGSVTAGGRYAARQRHLNNIEDKAGTMARHTYTGTVMAEQLQQAVHEGELQKTAPDVQKQLIHDKASGTGFEIMYIDTEMAMKKEKGQEDLEAVAKAAGIDEESLKTAVDSKGTLAVPLECFAQSEASSELLDSASFNVEADSMARMRDNAQYTLDKIKENADKLVEQQINMVQTIPQELYPEDTPEAEANRQLVEAAIITNMDNPAKGLRELIAQAEAEKMEILKPALDFLQDTSGKGVSIVDIGDGHTIRVSENAKWYQDFYKEHNRKPTKQELMDIASDMVGGKSNIEFWAVNDAQYAKEAEKVASDLAAIDKRLEALNGVKEKVQHINSTEMKIAESMSTDAYKVYRKYMDMLGNAPGMASRAARVNAVMFAHMMERLAENTRRATGNQEYTAMDAANRIMLDLNGRKYGNSMFAGKAKDTSEALGDRIYSPAQNPDEVSNDAYILAEDENKNKLVEEKEKQRQIAAKSELLESAPVVEIKDSPLVGKSKSELKDYFREMYQHIVPNEKYPQPTIAYTKYGEPINITVNGTFKEIMHHSADGNVVKLIPHLKEIIENSIFLFDEKPFSSRVKKNSAATISYKQYGCKIMLDGRPVLVRSAIRVATDGKYYYDLNVDNYALEKKDSSQFGRPEHKSGPPVKNPSKSASIISDWLEKVNTMEADSQRGNTEVTILNQAMVSGIDVDQLVDVVDITDSLPEGKVTNKSILAYIRSLIDDDTKIKTADNKAIMSILPKDARHITYSSKKTIDAKEFLNRGREIFSIKDLIAHSVLIERIPNTKKDRKPNVKAYYRFYVPVEIKGDIKTVRLVAEEQEGEIKANPLSVKLYDVIEEKKRRTNAPTGISPVEEIESPSSRISIRDMLRGVKDYDGNLYIPEGEKFNQVAWHGSPYDFDSFDLGAIGTGEGRQVHGWGLYFAQNEKTAQRYKQLFKRKNGLDGVMFKVDIPDTTNMLDEDKPLNEQPYNVKKAIMAYYESHPEQYIVPDNIDSLGGDTGKWFLKDLIFHKRMDGESSPEKAASMELRTLGIEGITYDGSRDGRCYVVFNDKAVSIIEKYNQDIKGQTAAVANGQYIVSLFEKADESTFMHEMAHVYLLELEKLAFLDEQCRADMDTIMEWATYKDGDEKLYKGSPFAKEFKTLAGNIRAAEDARDVEAVARLKRQWAHERFARGFEMYLEHGTAPSKALQSAFRKFKQFLRTLYIAFTGEGVRANAKVERVMARMLASEDEIEAMTLDERYKDISKAGGEKLLTETPKETYKRWYQEAKEEAKEKLMKVLMRDVEEEKQRKYQEALDAERESTRKNLENLPLYVAQKMIEETGEKNSIVETGLYSSYGAYEAELQEYGSLEDTLNTYMEEYAKELDQKILQEHTTEEQLAKMMEQTVYHKKLMAFEAEALRAKEATANKINSKTKSAIDEINTTLDNLPDGTDIKMEATSEGVRKVMQAINKLRFSTRWTAQELDQIENIAKQASKEDIEKALKQFTKEATAWKRNLKTIEDAFKGRMQIIKKSAREMLMKRSIADSCDQSRYVANEKQAAARVMQMVRAGKWDVAMIQQEVRFTSAAMAEAAEKNREQVNKILDKARKQLTAKTVRLPAEERYWIRRLAYDLKLDKNWQKDIGRPTSESARLVAEEPVRPEGCRDLRAIFTELQSTLEVQGDILDALEKIYQPGFTDYRALTMPELKACTDIMTVLYKTGKDKFQLKSFDGKLLSEVLDDITSDVDENGNIVNLPYVKQKKVNDDIGGIGYNDYLAKIPGLGPTLSQYGAKYLVAHMKPEEIIKLLGPTAHKYLYGLYDRAAGETGKRTAQAVEKLQEIMSVYSRKEKQDLSKQKYALFTGAGREMLSKENIICMALNMGTDTNFVRLYKGLDISADALQAFVEKNMTKKDWETVQKIWDYIGTFWPETVKVEEELNGITLEGVTPSEFTVMCEGKPLKMKGGYYPIAYNPVKSSKAEQQTMDAVTQTNMSGAQVLGTGRGFTKARSETDTIERPLLLQFNVIPEHLQNVIKNITFRIAARDAYRLTHSKGFEEHVRGTLGAEALRAIDQWVVDCWRTLPADTDQGTTLFSRSLGFLRRSAAINIMGYRLWPVVENITNIFPMMDYIGATNTISAIGDYMQHRKDNDKLLLKSVFMSNRINSMDRDIGTTPGIFEAGYAATDWLKEHAYSALTFTDLMFSKPLWCRAYKDSFAKNFKAVMKEEDEKRKTIIAAQDKVKMLKAEMSEDSKKLYVLKSSLQEGSEYEAEAGPASMKRIAQINNQIVELEYKLKPKQQELWDAERELERLTHEPEMTQSDILKEAEMRSVQEADAAIRSVFGSGQTKDLAAVQKGGEFLKLFTAFYSFFNTQANAILAAYYKGKFAGQDLTGAQNWGRWMPLAKAVFYRIILTSALATVMKMALLGDGSDDDHKYRKVEDEDGTTTDVEIPLLERFLVQFAKNTVSTASGTMVGLRDIIGLWSNLVFEGTDYGRGASIGSIGMGVIDKLTKTAQLVAKQEDRNARIDEQEERRKARYDKMTPEAKKKFDENLKYRKPVQRITYADIAKPAVQAITSVTAGYTGITDTMANAVMTTMQYMADGDGRYDKSLSNIVWSAVWNKKPVEVEVPKKPPAPKKKKGVEKK